MKYMEYNDYIKYPRFCRTSLEVFRDSVVVSVGMGPLGT